MLAGRCRVVPVFAALACAVSAARAEPSASPDLDRYEPGILPALGGDTDVGFRFGLYGQLARFHGAKRPYAWRAQALGAISVLEGATGVESPYREAYLRLDLPGVFAAPLRLQVDIDYLRTTNRGYYGIGNATRAERRWANVEPGSDAYVQARRYYQYDGATMRARVVGFVQVAPSVHWFEDLSLQHAQVAVYPGSLLANDVALGGLFGTGDTTQLGIGTGFVYDSRDHETVTTSGQWHDASVRCGPRLWGSEPWCGANVTLRGYLPVAAERFSVAARLLGDVVSARAPLLSLSSYGGVAGGTGPGGSTSVRGMPQGRLQGRTKLIGNLELRSFLLPFTIGDQHFCLGAAAFGDVTRVWTEPLHAAQPFDGDGLGLAWGIGAGPRVRWGDSLVIRFDVAYSPLGSALDAAPALYVDVDPVL